VIKLLVGAAAAAVVGLIAMPVDRFYYRPSGEAATRQAAMQATRMNIYAGIVVAGLAVAVVVGIALGVRAWRRRQ
jgi:hypothetical protein